MFRVLALGVFLALSASAQDYGGEDFRLINGKPVEPGTWDQVVRIQTGGAGCTATIVGPRVIITAAHCGNTGATSSFTYAGKKYSAVITRSPLYPGKDHDIAVGILSEDIAGVKPLTIGGKATSGLGITLLGYGCINVGGGGGNDGVLRIGDSVITGFQAFDMVSRKASGAALCFGDSGGPAFLIEGTKKTLLGINSKGNIKDTNYNARLDIEESTKFLKDIAQEKGVKICGVNQDCGGERPPPPPAPTCTLSANRQAIKIGSTITLALIASGNATAATIDGVAVNVPAGQRVITPNSVGNFTARGVVNGPGGTGECQATYKVENDPPPPEKPTCTLVAIPNEIKLGQSLTLELNSKGNVTEATIDNIGVPFPVGKRILTPTAKGNFTSNGRVAGPAGSGTCFADYRVTDDTPPPPPPETPNFAVVPTHCGDNKFPESGVSRGCLAIIKRDDSGTELKMNNVVLITYKDGTREVMPFASRKPKPGAPGDILQKEELNLYANNSIPGKDFQVLDLRPATLTLQGGVPRSLEGRTVKGKYFILENLKAFGIKDP